MWGQKRWHCTEVQDNSGLENCPSKLCKSKTWKVCVLQWNWINSKHQWHCDFSNWDPLQFCTKSRICNVTQWIGQNCTGRDEEPSRKGSHLEKHITSALFNSWWMVSQKQREEQKVQQDIIQRTLDKQLSEKHSCTIWIQIHGLSSLLCGQVGSPCQPKRLYSQLPNSWGHYSRDGFAEQPFGVTLECMAN